MLSLKGLALISSILIFIFLGLSTKNTQYYLLAIPIFTYTSLALLTSSESEIKINCDRIIENSLVGEGEECKVELLITNESKSKIEKIYVEDRIPKEAKIIKGNTKLIFSLKPNETRKISYVLKFDKIGKYMLEDPIFTIYDQFGIRKYTFVLDAKKEIKVSPKIPLIHGIKLIYRNLKVWPGEILSKRQGIGNEFFGVSEYIEGDELRRINWKAYAKTGKLMKNLFHYELGTESIIVVDYRSINNIERSGKNILEEEAKLALLISYKMLRDRYRVGLLIIGEKLYRVKPSFGIKQFNRILSTILEASPGMAIDIRLLKEYIPLLFPITVHLIYISPAIDESSILALIELVRKGYHVTAILPSPLEFIDFDKVEYKEIVRKYLEIERKSILARLSRYCNVIDWKVDQPIDVVISKNFEAWRRFQRR